MLIYLYISITCGHFWTSTEGDVVPLAGIEPALREELDFESSASTSSATGAIASESYANIASINFGSTSY